jgi:hypothetical protein
MKIFLFPEKNRVYSPLDANAIATRFLPGIFTL